VSDGPAPGGIVRDPPTRFPPLPCYPCPHRSACCAHGVTLQDAEAEPLARKYGRDTVYYVKEEAEWRTRVVGDRCVFLRDNRCVIHDDPHYPLVCRTFPWIDAETGGPYQFDRTICPEFSTRPDLVRLQSVERDREKGDAVEASSNAPETG